MDGGVVMHIIKVGFWSILAIVLLQSSAAASEDPGGWTKAKWGMTDAQIEAAFPGQVRHYEKPAAWDSGMYADIYIPHVKVGSDSFEARFQMDGSTKKLVQVVLTKEGKDASFASLDAVEDMLATKYGPPSETHKSQTTVKGMEYDWTFPTTRIAASYTDLFVAKLLIINYRQRSTAGSPNL